MPIVRGRTRRLNFSVIEERHGGCRYVGSVRSVKRQIRHHKRARSWPCPGRQQTFDHRAAAVHEVCGPAAFVSLYNVFDDERVANSSLNRDVILLGKPFDDEVRGARILVALSGLPDRRPISPSQLGAGRMPKYDCSLPFCRLLPVPQQRLNRRRCWRRFFFNGRRDHGNQR